MIQSILVLHNILIIHDRVSTDFFVESEQDMNAALAEFDMGKVICKLSVYLCPHIFQFDVQHLHLIISLFNQVVECHLSFTFTSINADEEPQPQPAFELPSGSNPDGLRLRAKIATEMWGPYKQYMRSRRALRRNQG